MNLISELVVKKLGLETKPHHKPYHLSWVCDNDNINVTKQCRVKFVIASKLIDKIEMDVVHLGICGIFWESFTLMIEKQSFLGMRISTISQKMVCSML